MSQEHAQAHVLDLTATQTLFELALEPKELLGSPGAKLIADLKERAVDADYTHMYFRDPIRPGIIWFTELGDTETLNLPMRARLEQSRVITENVFPGFLSELAVESPDELVMSHVPPITSGPSGLELATALEYIVAMYPAMVRAWAALIFTYDQLLQIKAGAESARDQCLSVCPYPQIVSYFLESGDSGATQ